MKDSLYQIPPGCICLGDGLYGMKCTAPEHARLKPDPPVAIQRLLDEVRNDPDRPAGAVLFDRAHNRHNRS